MTAFETRDAGNVLEIELGQNEDNPGICDLVMKFQSTAQEADRVSVQFEFYKGSPQQMSMPTFRVNRYEQNLTLVEGKWTMMRIFDSSRNDAPKGSKVVMWVNVETLDSKKP